MIITYLKWRTVAVIELSAESGMVCIGNAGFLQEGQKLLLTPSHTRVRGHYVVTIISQKAEAIDSVIYVGDIMVTYFLGHKIEALLNFNATIGNPSIHRQIKR